MQSRTSRNPVNLLIVKALFLALLEMARIRREKGGPGGSGRGVAPRRQGFLPASFACEHAKVVSGHVLQNRIRGTPPGAVAGPVAQILRRAPFVGNPDR